MISMKTSISLLFNYFISHMLALNLFYSRVSICLYNL